MSELVLVLSLTACKAGWTVDCILRLLFLYFYRTDVNTFWMSHVWNCDCVEFSHRWQLSRCRLWNYGMCEKREHNHVNKRIPSNYWWTLCPSNLHPSIKKGNIWKSCDENAWPDWLLIPASAYPSARGACPGWFSQMLLQQHRSLEVALKGSFQQYFRDEKKPSGESISKRNHHPEGVKSRMREEKRISSHARLPKSPWIRLRLIVCVLTL